jgi:Arc/MetJ family transcription regulator
MLYIMRRTQLYLEDELWAALHAKALLEGATVSELVRVAVRERYMGDLEERRQAMLGIVGLWKDRNDLDDTETMVRRLRSGARLKRAQAGLRAK